MKLEIDLNVLRNRKLFIATPMYGGACSGQYTKSMCDLSVQLTQYQIPHVTYFLFNESLITRARNYLVDEFLRSDCTHLMFIDSDIGFIPKDVVALLAISDTESDKDIVCAPYPKKTIAWEKIREAVNKGVADDNPNELSNYVGDFVFNPAYGVSSFKVDEPVEVLEGGTGFMLIQRKVFEKYAAAYPHLAYRPDHVRTKHFDGSRKIHAYFDCVITPEIAVYEVSGNKGKKNTRGAEIVEILPDGTRVCNDVETGEEVRLAEADIKGITGNRYLSEDYMFCQYARKIGLKVWMCPWMRLSHFGSYMFSGSLPHLASVQIHPTADKSQLGKAT